MEKTNTMPLEVEHDHGVAQAELGTMSSSYGKTCKKVQSKR